MKNFTFILILMTLGLFINLKSHSNPTPPNFIIIFIDDLGYADLGCYGATQISTPNIDRLAKQGMRFTSFYAQHICGPSRAALMTGCYPMRVAEKDNKKNIHPILHTKEITIAEILKSKNYTTACFGKWDLAKHSQKDFHKELMPNHQGFDYFFGTPSSNDGFIDIYRNEERIESKSNMATITKRYTDEAINFIKNNKDKPFFVYIPHTMPHTRLAASPDFKGKSKRGLYGDVVEEIDHNTGRILSTIQNLKLQNNTYIFLISDNGPWLIKNKYLADGHLPNDHGGSAGPFRSGKVSTWEGGVRVPAIAWAPGRIPPDSTCHNIASTLDILPTLAALANAEIPNDRIIDGENINHLLTGNFKSANPDKTFLYYQLTHLQAVRQGKWKLHLPVDNPPHWLGPFYNNRHIAKKDRLQKREPFLVNLEQDLGETTNLATQNPHITARLLKIAQAARHDIGDYNQVGKNMRFFDQLPTRPKLPPVNWKTKSNK